MSRHVLIIIDTPPHAHQCVEYFAKTSSSREDKVTILLLEAEHRSVITKMFHRQGSTPSLPRSGRQSNSFFRSQSNKGGSLANLGEKAVDRHLSHVKPRLEHSYENVMLFKELEGVLMFNGRGVPPSNILWEVITFDSGSIHSRNTNMLQYLEGERYGLIVTCQNDMDKDSASIANQVLSHAKIPTMIVPLELEPKVKERYSKSRVCSMPQDVDCEMFDELMKEMHVSVDTTMLSNGNGNRNRSEKSHPQNRMEATTSSQHVGNATSGVDKIPLARKQILVSSGEIHIKKDESPKPAHMVFFDGVSIELLSEEEVNRICEHPKHGQSKSALPKVRDARSSENTIPADDAMIGWVKELMNPHPMLATMAGKVNKEPLILPGRIDDTIPVPQINHSSKTRKTNHKNNRNESKKAQDKAIDPNKLEDRPRRPELGRVGSASRPISRGENSPVPRNRAENSPNRLKRTIDHEQKLIVRVESGPKPVEPYQPLDMGHCDQDASMDSVALSRLLNRGDSEPRTNSKSGEFYQPLPTGSSPPGKKKHAPVTTHSLSKQVKVS